MSKTFSHTAGSTTVRAVFSDATEVACAEVGGTSIGGRSLYTLLDADIVAESLVAGIYTVRILDGDAPILDLIDFDWDGSNERNRVDSVSNPVTVGTNTDKSGYVLSASQSFSTTGSVGDVSGKVLGGGSGTITGAGAHVKDHVGNYVATEANVNSVSSIAETAANNSSDLVTRIGLPTGTTIAEDIADIQAGVTIPVIQVPVPASRTWILKQTSDGLRGELPLTRVIGESQPFAVDFRNDLSNNGRLISLDAISFVGTAGGIVIDPLDRGVDRSEAKFKIEALIAGTYVITVSVTYDDSDGGGTSIGDVTLIVK